jgi:hypothetical protein
MISTPSDEKEKITQLLSEMHRLHMDSELINQAKGLLANNENREEIFNEMEIDQGKLVRATNIKIQIDTLTTQINSLRYRICQASKMMGKKLFSDNTETLRISNQLGKRWVIDEDQLHLFIDDLSKFIYQSAKWGPLYNLPQINPTLKMIESYRNNFDHIFDMHGGGNGAEKAFTDLGKITESLLGHPYIRTDEYLDLQIKILTSIRDMLVYVENNLDRLLREKQIDG